MPVNPEALLISAMIRTQDFTTPISKGVTSEHFHAYREEYRWLELYVTKHRKTPSRSTFKSQFNSFTFYKNDDLEHHCEEVIRKHLRHALIQAVEHTMDLVDAGDIDSAAKKLHGEVAQIRAQSSGTGGDFNIFEDWEESYADVSGRVERVAQYGQAGIPTGFRTLDQNTGGLQPGWLTIVGARLGQGKTWSMIRMAWAAVTAGYGVQYFSLEQSRHQIALRTHAFASSKYGKEVFQSLDLMRGQGFDLIKYKKFLKEMQDTIAGAFIVNDTTRGKISTASIAASLEQKRGQTHIVFVDYLTLLEGGNVGYKEVGAISSDLKGIGEHYQVPIVSASQINRMGIGKEPPGPETLSGADAIGQDADLLITMRQQSARVMKMRNAKFRHGPDGYSWYCRFSPGTGQYDEISGDEAAELIELDHEVD